MSPSSAWRNLWGAPSAAAWVSKSSAAILACLRVGTNTMAGWPSRACWVMAAYAGRSMACGVGWGGWVGVWGGVVSARESAQAGDAPGDTGSPRDTTSCRQARAVTTATSTAPPRRGAPSIWQRPPPACAPPG